MADETLNKGPEGEKLPESPAPDGPGAPPAPEQAEQVTLPGMGEGGPAPSGKVINLSDVRGDDDKGGKAPAVEAEKPEKRRGRPPKEQAEPKSPKAEKTAKPRAGRPPKGDKAARAEAQPSTRDKVSQSKKKTPEKGSGGMGPPKSPPKGKAGPVKAAAAPVPEINLPPTPAEPPRPVEEGKVVYLKLSELHAFHTFREHPYKVQDDKAMDDLVGTIKEHALISMCLGCAFIVFGLLSFIGILQPTSTSIVQSQRNIGIVFSVLGVAFLIAQAIFTALASAKKKSYYELISNGIKVNGIVEKVYMQKFLQYGKKSPYRVLYSYTYGGKIYHHKSHLLWDKPYMKETDSIAVYINDSEKSAIQL